jgi:hypothetical protein
MEMAQDAEMGEAHARKFRRAPSPRGLLRTAKSAATKHYRLLFLFIFTITNLVYFIIYVTRTPHHLPFVAPSAVSVVHGKHITSLPEPTYPLTPFPDSPLRWTDEEIDHVPRERAPWLAAVISAASDAERRMLIRSTWMRLYKNVPFDGRFVVSNPGPQWTDTVRLENSTFGDMIVLDNLQEDDITANTVKTLELYQWLIDHDHKYEFVSKMDTDVWFNARGFWDRYLLPNMSNRTGTLVAEIDRTVIGELYYSIVHDLVYPHGAMYTFTWDMIEMFAKLQKEHQVITGEDMTLAMLLLKAKKVVKFINFKGTEKFDFDPQDTRGDGTAWARQGSHQDAIKHAIHGFDTIAIHELKHEDDYLRVADCFDESGVIEEPPIAEDAHVSSTPFSLRWHDFWDSLGMSKRYMTKLDKVPESFWTMANGTWRCDDIWDMGTSKDGFQ